MHTLRLAHCVVCKGLCDSGGHIIGEDAYAHTLLVLFCVERDSLPLWLAIHSSVHGSDIIGFGYYLLIRFLNWWNLPVV